MIFSEVSPRPYDTGMVTLISQDLSNSPCTFAPSSGYPSALSASMGPPPRGDPSAVVQPERQLWPAAVGLGAGLQLRLFGKPEIDGTRRLGVTLAVADSVEEAVAR